MVPPRGERVLPRAKTGCQRQGVAPHNRVSKTGCHTTQQVGDRVSKTECRTTRQGVRGGNAVGAEGAAAEDGLTPLAPLLPGFEELQEKMV